MWSSEKFAVVGLAIVSIVALATGRYAADGLERRVERGAAAAVSSLQLGEVVVAANGLNVEISGRVRDASQRDAAIARVAAADGVSRVIDNLMIVEPLVDLRPAVLRVTRDETSMTLSGEAPSREARDLLLARVAAGLDGRRLVNLMATQDRRASAAWLAAAEAALDAMAEMEGGEAIVARGVVTLTGSVGDARLKETVIEMLRRRLRGGFTLEATIEAPPPFLASFVFALRRTADGYELEACAAPDAQSQAQILELLGARASALAVAENCPVALGAPGGWLDAVRRAIVTLDLLEEGEARVVDDAAQVAGFASEGAELSLTRAQAQTGWPAGYAVTTDLRAAARPVDLFEMTIVMRSGEARLSGHTPSLGRAADWAAALDATNELSLARGAPERWVEVVDAVVTVLRDVEIGAATIAGYDIVVAIGGDASTRARARGRLAARLPNQYRLRVVEARAPRDAMVGAAETAEGAETPPSDRERGAGGASGEGLAVLAPPSTPGGAPLSFGGPVAALAPLVGAPTAPQSTFVFAARLAEDGAVVVTGVAGDETSRDAIETYARAKLGGERLRFEMRVGEGAPPAGWQRTVFAGLDALAFLSQGEVVAEDGALYLRGTVLRAFDARQALLAAEEKAPETVRRFSWITVAEDATEMAQEEDARRPLTPTACVEAMNRLTQADPIVFESGEASASASMDAVFDQLATILGRCPAARVEVGGHTDSVGEDETNLLLSRRRAFAVRLALIGRGVAAERLESAGYGASQPVADNETEEGRALNRRIAFRLVE